jgi:hypothetical protein
MRTFEQLSGECRVIQQQIRALIMEHRYQRGNIVEQLKIIAALSSLQVELGITQSEIRDRFII